MQQVLEAISDPTRRKILDLLKKGEKSAGELGENFDISGPSMSHHLSKLKAADLVIATRRGQSIYYSINTSVFEDAAQFVLRFFQDRGENKL
ncbi:MAG: winged helix-turn-helix transcriptional regulator [Pseudohongiella sp.]|jgi:ArsR family transcriptional regulator, arsenate/arsenite/antimonite-responsive transcriptional repressor|nr:winged helix-turn-helix transcriptional regulator [Pseudohongiella sp.]